MPCSPAHATRAAVNAFEHKAAAARAQFSYDMSPIQIIVAEQRRRWYHFVTTTSAIVGGVFTVAGIVDGLVHATASMAQKVDLGKQG